MYLIGNYIYVCRYALNLNELSDTIISLSHVQESGVVCPLHVGVIPSRRKGYICYNCVCVCVSVCVCRSEAGVLLE